MRSVRPFAAFLILLAASLVARAATNSADVAHLHVQLVIPTSSLSRSQPTHAGLYFKLENGWHIYWKNAGDSGEPPRINWTLPDGVTAGPIQFPAPQRLPLGPLMDFGYENEVLFPFDITVATTAKSGSVPLHAKVNWLVCREVCIPGKAELETDRNLGDQSQQQGSVEPDASLYARLAHHLPQSLPLRDKAMFAPTASGFRLTVETGQKETEAIFFPADQNVLDNPAPQKLTPTSRGFFLDLKKDANLTANPGQLHGVLELSGGRAFDINALTAVAAVPSSTAALKSAATGSATTPATPPATATNPSPATEPTPTPISPAPSPGLARIVPIAFLGGLILNLMPCVFPVLFLKGLALVQSGNEERHKLRNHGLFYTVGILVSFWILVAVLLALRAAGARLGWGFQFQSPIFLILISSLLFFLGLSLAGQFEIGLTLTSAGGSLAQKQGYTGSFFTGVLAVIVATPCTAPFMGAAIGYALAQPAAVTFAVFTALGLGLAAPYAVLTLQPAWTRLLPRPGAWMEVLRQAISVPIFLTVIWLAWVLAQAYGASLLAALLIAFLLIAIAGWFLGRWPAQRWATATAVVILLLVAGLSALAPARLAIASATAPTSAHAGEWEPWTATAVASYQSQGRPVFVDFTAKWCLSCQVNERVALTQPEVRKAFADANVALLRADWTQHDEDIAQTLTSLGRSGVPAYALYAPNAKSPQLLPEVLTPTIVTDALSKLPHAATQSALASSNKR